jgi:hypothetical protein
VSDETPKPTYQDPLADSHPLREKEQAMDAAALSGTQPGKIQGAGYISRNGHIVVD